MAIKPTGPKPPTFDVGRVEPTKSDTAKAAQSFSTAAVAPSSAASGAQAPEVVAAAKHVAAELRAGRIDRSEAPDAAIEHIVRAQSSGGSERAIRARIDEVQLMLGDDPHFVRALDALLDKAAATSAVD